MSYHEEDEEELNIEKSPVDDETSIALSVDRYRCNTGVDRRFSAAPIDNDTPLFLGHLSVPVSRAGVRYPLIGSVLREDNLASLEEWLQLN